MSISSSDDKLVRRAGNALRRVLRICAVPFALLAVTQLAHAHTAPFGITGYPVLVLHPFIVLDHALCLAAAGLLAGQQKRPGVAASLGVLLAGLVAGFAVLILTPGFPGNVLLPLVWAFVTGIVVALAPNLSRWTVTAFVGIAGFCVGLNTYPEAPMPYVLALTLGGLLLGAGILFTAVAWPASRLRRNWQRIGVRILGSWVAAIVCLVLALFFR